MDSRMLEVAIGLALVFALFGLLVTAIHEGLAQAMKSRGKTLRLAVKSLMGNDEEAATRLMKHPLLVSMVDGDAKSTLRPSYLSSDVFVSAFVSQLTTAYLGSDDKPATPGEFVTRLANPDVKLSADLTGSLKTLMSGVETDWPAFEQRLCAWYDAVGERATGWYKRSTQRDMLIIGTIAAAVLNINPIVIGPRLWDDDLLRKSLVTAGEAASKAYSEAAADPASAAAAGAAAGVNSLKGAKDKVATASASKVTALPESAKVERLILDVRQRLDAAAATPAGRAADDATLALLQALGGINRLVKALDVARIAEDGTLERQRQGLQASSDLESEITALRSLAALNIARPLGGDLPVKVDDLKKAIDEELQARDAARRVRTPPGECDKAQSPEALAVCKRMNDLNALQIAGLPVGWSPTYFPNVVGSSSCKRVEWTVARLQAQIAKSGERTEESPEDRCAGPGLLTNPNSWFALFGWLLTGLAGTLGATFWFDLLTRFVKLRGAGGKPESTSAAGASAAGGTTSATPPSPAGAGGVMARPATSAPAPRAPASSDVLNLAEASLTSTEVEEIQRTLKVAATGYFDQTTRDAIAVWQRDRKDPETGELTAAQIITLLGRPPSGDGEGFVG